MAMAIEDKTARLQANMASEGKSDEARNLQSLTRNLNEIVKTLDIETTRIEPPVNMQIFDVHLNSAPASAWSENSAREQKRQTRWAAGIPFFFSPRSERNPFPLFFCEV